MSDLNCFSQICLLVGVGWREKKTKKKKRYCRPKAWWKFSCFLLLLLLHLMSRFLHWTLGDDDVGVYRMSHELHCQIRLSSLLRICE